ncbi:MAG: double-strand break repair helicase AddA [Rhizobiaceae bacterium]|nr:double-strand break repair helicase AddA [Rhizobiaceae bacterium]MCV0404708.1 double-strand break repair helicase AddA [Rhizobiaceae bacterium]
MSDGKEFHIPADTKADQMHAADPSNSAWVAANAGSGKTHVLSRRVMRLLLAGIEPSRILCLTYTKAAAANMSNRVFRDLALWTTLEEKALADELAVLEGRRPDADRLAEARRLFARSLDTPGGLKIQTIHAFCEAVLHQFPLEANIAGHFELLDSAAERALIAEARRELLTGISAGHAKLSAAFAEVLARGGESGLDALLGEIVAKRDGIRTFLAEIGGVDGLDLLFGEFGFDASHNPASIAAAVWPPAGFETGRMKQLAEAAQACGARKTLEVFLPAAHMAWTERDPLVRLRLLGNAFLRKDGAPYSATWLFPKALHTLLPDLQARYEEAAASIAATIERLRLWEMLTATKAALTLAHDLIARYERLKTARGLLDFNDLIGRTVNLLSRADASAWVLYRLDRGIDHILVDEAQDTSPGQWAVVRSLADEFFAGKGSRDNDDRTIFAVGDEKQSIYSFQGAEPHAFAESRGQFRRRVEEAGRSFRPVRLWRSFRSVGDVLAAVDTVFADPDARRGLTRDPEDIRHEPIRASATGYVELWPSIGREKAEEPEDWAEPIDHVSMPAVVLAERIAATIRRWIDEGDILEETGKPITAGDILVLVRKRDRFVHALSRALKNLRDPRIAVAGADRLNLAAHIAVQDLIAIGRFVLQARDDLSLAALLKSPLFGLDEETLFRLAWNRPKGVSLWARLKEASEGDPLLRSVVTTLSAWRDEVDLLPPFEFYAGILGRDRGRRKFLQRLGHEVGEILDEFLSFCLAEERIGLPGLEALLATLQEVAPEIKREMDQERNEVRIMTVHAAKGLEAPVVFLVDGGGAPFSGSHLPRLVPFEPPGRSWNGRGWLWRASADVANSASRTIEARIEESALGEYRRLLYVGMTRAEDRLIVCGYHGLKGPRSDTWHAMVDRGLRDSPHASETLHPAVPDETVIRFRVTPTRHAVPAARLDNAIRRPPFPVWMNKAPPPPPTPPSPLLPSGAALLVETGRKTEGVLLRSPVLAPEEEPAAAIVRGSLVHRLLQSLPELDREAREVAASRYLDNAAPGWAVDAREEIWRSIRSIFDDPAFAPVFTPGSRAEVEVAGVRRVGGLDRAISARVDRIAVRDDRVLVVDYKTGRPPISLSGVQPSYIVQMALYRDLIRPLYPGKTVSTALLFTEAPVLLELPDAVLDSSLAEAGLA